MRAIDRQILPSDPAKTSRFPRTQRRSERIREVLSRRQPDLTVVLENVHDPHNIGAVLRSCDAVGVLAVHTIYTVEERPQRAYARSTSGSASKWVDIYHHDSVEACFGLLQERGFRIAVAALTDTVLDLYSTDFTQPIAILFGNEQRGASREAIAAADQTIEIPMMGMVESLNISVACAVTLFEAQRQRRDAGCYRGPRMSEAELQVRSAEWLKR